MNVIFENDLPDRVSPMGIKELRQGMRRKTFIVPFILTHFLAGVAILLECRNAELSKLSSQAEMGGILNPLPFWDPSRPFWMVAAFVCVLMIPFSGLNLVSQELKDENHELLQMSNLSRWNIILGKFISLWGLSLLTILSLAPYSCMRYFIGGVNISVAMAAMVSLVFASGMNCAIVLAISAFQSTRGRIGMFIVVYGSVALSLFIALASANGRSNGFGILYSVNAVVSSLSVMVMALSLARARLRLIVTNFETRPSTNLIGAFIVCPFVVGIGAIVSFGFLACMGYVLVAFLARYIDISPKAPKWAPASLPNIPSKQVL